ncbi:MAG: formate dehydrogenase accessory sulfurtransferase FdhD [Acidobacteriaceae bacterium]|nr:formate dehydrogenase accessory sulfurtransferase FdhD [Acidobacteriaceae bacterium]
MKRIRGSESERVLDAVATEEPLEIRVRYWFKDTAMTQSVAVTMRTPGNDRELTVGFLLAEGIIRSRDDLAELYPLGGEPSNEVLAELEKHVDFEAWRMARTTFVSSSCGICGKRSREALASEVPAWETDAFQVDRSLIERLPALLGREQAGFAQTGGLHAAAVVDAEGRIEAVFEDIGRHNALDKLTGWCLLKGQVPLRDRVLFLSSRSSFELIQKAAMAGAPILATVGGPSSLAIEAAQEHGITLIGFVREKRFNIYSGDWRVRV